MPEIVVGKFGDVTFWWPRHVTRMERNLAERDYRAASGRRGFIQFTHHWPLHRDHNKPPPVTSRYLN